MEPIGGEPTPATAPASTTPARASVLASERARRRPAPRAGIATAAAGCALVVLGILLVGGDGLAGDDGGDGSQLPGIFLSLAAVAGGLAVLAKRAEGPIATAGSVAATFGIPPLLFFLSFDAHSVPPYSTELILYGSTVAWVVLWLVGPARGRSVLLGAAAFGLWASVVQATEKLFTSPFLFVSSSFLSTTSDSGDFGFRPVVDTPDPTTIGALSILLGLGLLLLARSWDLRAWVGAATPLVAVALVILPLGVSFLGSDLEGVGTGIVAVVVGALVTALGASAGRRATTWAGAAGIGAGFVAVVFDLVDSSATAAGLVLVVVGAGVVLGAQILRDNLGEPDELVEGRYPIGPLVAVPVTGGTSSPPEAF